VAATLIAVIGMRLQKPLPKKDRKINVKYDD
jgi:hypothetical protein